MVGLVGRVGVLLHMHFETRVQLANSINAESRVRVPARERERDQHHQAFKPEPPHQPSAPRSRLAEEADREGGAWKADEGGGDQGNLHW